MEQSESYKHAAATIAAIERELSLSSSNTICKQSLRKVEEEIEEYFAKLLNTLAARKASLLEDVQQQFNNQKKSIDDSRVKLEASLKAYKHTMEAASMMYSFNPGASELMYKSISDTIIPKINASEITVNLPTTMIGVIQTLGKVDFSDCYSVAGNNNQSVQFTTPTGVCYSPLNMCFYACNYNNSTIHKISMKGEVSTFVAANAGLKYPNGVALYHKENSLFVANGAHSISKVSTEGVVSVFAGSEQPGYVDAVGTNARFNNLGGITIDQHSGTIFVSDYNNNLIRKITPEGVVSTLAGSQTKGFADKNGAAAQFSKPWGMCFDEKNNSLLVCDYCNNRLRQVELNGDVTTLCDIPSPAGIALASNGTIFVASHSAHKIFKIICAGQQYKVVELAGCGKKERIDGKPAASGFYNPIGIVIHEPSRSCFIADCSSHTIRRITFTTSTSI